VVSISRDATVPEQTPSAQQCQYRLPLLYLPHVLAQRVHPSWPRLCKRGITILRRAWHSMCTGKKKEYHSIIFINRIRDSESSETQIFWVSNSNYVDRGFRGLPLARRGNGRSRLWACLQKGVLLKLPVCDYILVWVSKTGTEPQDLETVTDWDWNLKEPYQNLKRYFVMSEQERWPRMRSTQKDELCETHVYSYNLKVVNDSAPPLVFSSKRVLKITVDST